MRATLNPAQISEVIALAWADDVSFDVIEAETGLSEDQVIALMRRELKRRSYTLWRRRVTGRSSKHAARARPDHLDAE